MSVSRKTGEIYYTKEEQQSALQNNNALRYALSRHYKLIKSSRNTYTMKEHDSMVFTLDGRWYWNSQGITDASGHAPHALDFIQNYEGKSYREAVCILAGTIDLPALAGPVQNIKLPPPEEKQEFILPERAGNFRNLFAYLVKERGIDSALVKAMVERHQVYQGITYNKLKIVGYSRDRTARYNFKEKFEDEFAKMPRIRESINTGADGAPYHTEKCLDPETVLKLLGTGQIRMYQNLVMVGYDEKRTARYASMRSMNSSGKPVKVDVAGSNKSYPFTLEGSSGSDTVCVFESPIEAMSYQTLCKITDSNRISCQMISLGGAAAIQALDRYLREHPKIRSIVSGLNNDSNAFGHDINAGRNGTEKIIEKYGPTYAVTAHTPFLNDWNDVLKNYRKELEGEPPEQVRPVRSRQSGPKAKQMGMAI
ncbi:hypothetical protein EQM14_04810 [Caproiciproducens sp. NJN-50]|uniref:toprim domain-containing protein n=1 Tax=Caproiciproducens sp. NJN-50 TaxID=2507162 RepID=UPI000FFE1C68|nr:toprim domain-containing protein [Caproiciproducens sp. NJN-50]QAT49149.1 hypothetical protein EQM14_04810 [Caproiciproducens sp. NJN-50]